MIGEQLSFEKAFELADAVARLLRLEQEKKEMAESYNSNIKLEKRKIAKLSAEIEQERGRIAA